VSCSRPRSTASIGSGRKPQACRALCTGLMGKAWAGKAGPIRKQQMLDEGKPDLVVAFPGGRGTAHMVRIARAAGIEVIEASGIK
jgi:hypothetical protein